MINCSVKFFENKIIYLKISGHANYAEYGKDIVCSAVSILCYAIGNKILNIDKNFELTIKENDFIFDKKNSNKDIDLLLETLYEGLLMIEVQYPKNIEIMEV